MKVPTWRCYAPVWLVPVLRYLDLVNYKMFEDDSCILCRPELPELMKGETKNIAVLFRNTAFKTLASAALC